MREQTGRIRRESVPARILKPARYFGEFAHDLPEADDLVVNFQGFRAPNSAFMVAIPAAALG